MSSGRAPRIVVFTHDTFGLGHVRRCKHIVRAVIRRLPDAAVLFITGSPALEALTDLPPNVDYLKIPTIVKTGAPETRPPHLPIGTRDVISLRKRVIRSAVDSFRPDLFLVDNFPVGSTRELLPTLARLRELAVPTVVGLRDIVDRPEVVRATWVKEKVYDALRDSYDRILVYGTPDILDVKQAYALIPEVAAKVRYCGYVTSLDRPARRELGLRSPVALATVGGGGDGFPLLSRFVRAVREIPDLSAVAVTGPLMAPVDRERIRELAGGEKRIVVRESVADLPSYLCAADLIVAMGGYNTVAELLALRRWALVVPRNWRYGEYTEGERAGLEWEQPMRARALERLGALRVVTPEELTAETVAEALAEAMQRRREGTATLVDVEGVERAADEIVSMIASRVDHAQA